MSVSCSLCTLTLRLVADGQLQPFLVPFLVSCPLYSRELWQEMQVIILWYQPNLYSTIEAVGKSVC